MHLNHGSQGKHLKTFKKTKNKPVKQTKPPKNPTHETESISRLCIPAVCKQPESALTEPPPNTFINYSLMHSFEKGTVLTQDTQALCLENLLKWRKVNDQ